MGGFTGVISWKKMGLEFAAIDLVLAFHVPREGEATVNIII